jgi:hypothetical protein
MRLGRIPRSLQLDGRRCCEFRWPQARRVQRNPGRLHSQSRILETLQEHCCIRANAFFAVCALTGPIVWADPGEGWPYWRIRAHSQARGVEMADERRSRRESARSTGARGGRSRVSRSARAKPSPRSPDADPFERYAGHAAGATGPSSPAGDCRERALLTEAEVSQSGSWVVDVDGGC